MMHGRDGAISGNRTPSHGGTAGIPLPPRSGNAETPFRLGHRSWLDGLRGIAVLLVLAYHLRLLRGGSFGVDVFFVLSGFLITTLLVEEWRLCGTIDLKRFYARRGLRLLPAFAVVLGIAWLFNLHFRTPEDLASFRREMIVAACYVANWPVWHQVPMPTLGHTWSLSVEEQFYLLWPLLLLGMLRMRLAPRTIALSLCAGSLASAVLRGALFESRRSDPTAVLQLYTGLHTRADALLIGCLVGVLASWNLLPRTPQFRRRMRVAAGCAAATLGYLFLYRDWWRGDTFRWLFALAAVAIAIILIHLLSSPSRWEVRILEWPPLVGTGRISYALYLYHIPFMLWLHWEPLGWEAPEETLTVAGLSFAAAVASYFVVERPCLRWKSRLRPPLPAAPIDSESGTVDVAVPARESRAAA